MEQWWTVATPSRTAAAVSSSFHNSFPHSLRSSHSLRSVARSSLTFIRSHRYVLGRGIIQCPSGPTHCCARRGCACAGGPPHGDPADQPPAAGGGAGPEADPWGTGATGPGHVLCPRPPAELRRAERRRPRSPGSRGGRAQAVRGRGGAGEGLMGADRLVRRLVSRGTAIRRLDQAVAAALRGALAEEAEIRALYRGTDYGQMASLRFLQRTCEEIGRTKYRHRKDSAAVSQLRAAVARLTRQQQRWYAARVARRRSELRTWRGYGRRPTRFTARTWIWFLAGNSGRRPEPYARELEEWLTVLRSACEEV